MGGENKAFLPVDGEMIIDRLYNLFGRLFSDIVVVTNDPLQYLQWDAMIVADLFSIRSSLTGIHAGLFHAPSPHVFVTACDTPFLQEALVKRLLQELEPKWDVIIPVTEKGHQPLCAIYSKRCIKPIERQLKNEDLKILEFFSRVKVKRIPEAELRAADPHLDHLQHPRLPTDGAGGWHPPGHLCLDTGLLL